MSTRTSVTLSLAGNLLEQAVSTKIKVIVLGGEGGVALKHIIFI